jgi:hypothetical protein
MTDQIANLSLRAERSNPVYEIRLLRRAKPPSSQ